MDRLPPERLLDAPVGRVAPAFTPERAEELLQEGLRLHQDGDVGGALERYHAVLHADRKNVRALYFGTVAMSQLGRPADLMIKFMEHALDPRGGISHEPEPNYNLGIMLHRARRVADAVRYFEKALSIHPRMAEARFAYASALLNLGERERGEREMLRVARQPCSESDQRYARAFARLTLGDWFGGWADYDHRWRVAGFLMENRRSARRGKRWNGSPIPGKHLYVHTEQGAGDMVMISRLLARLREVSRAERLTLEVGENLVPLLRGVAGADEVVPTLPPLDIGILPPNVPQQPDYLVAALGIPRWLGITAPEKIPSPRGWLSVAGDAPLPRREPGRLVVGVSWQGSTAHKNDAFRSIEWETFRDLLVFDRRFGRRVTWVAVQHGIGHLDGGVRVLHQPIHNLASSMGTFADTARIVRDLDLLITVDTATAHIAGALVNGPPIWTLLPASPDWRWGLHGSTTPWYARMRLFRQERYDDWRGPLRQAADALAERLEGRELA